MMANWMQQVGFGMCVWTFVGAQMCVAADTASAVRDALPAGEQVEGSGSWNSAAGDGQAVAITATRSTPQRWQMQVARGEDDSLSGTVTVDDSPLMRTGTLTGKVDGQGVTGTIHDQQGRVAASFTGTLTKTGGMRGRYEDRTGETGTWVWDGPLGN